jgi:hypothetical protein
MPQEHKKCIGDFLSIDKTLKLTRLIPARKLFSKKKRKNIEFSDATFCFLKIFLILLVSKFKQQVIENLPLSCSF